MRSSRLVLALLIVVFFWGSGRTWAGSPSPAGKWLRICSPHFTVFSNASERKTRRMVEDLERLAQTMLHILPGTKTAPSQENIFFVFRSGSDFEDYLPVRFDKQLVAGFHMDSAEGSFSAANAKAWDDYRHTLYHEYLHEFLRRNYRPLPAWLNEGMPEYFSTFRFDGEVAEIGRPVETYVRLLRSRPWLTIDELLAVRSAVHESSDAQTLLFYAESWATVHRLMLGKPQRTSELMRYVGLLQSGVEPDQAFSQAFSCDSGVLLHEVREHVSRPSMPFVKLPLAGFEIDESVDVAQLTKSETLCALGELIAHCDSESFAVAQEHFDQARKWDRGYSPAYSGLGYLADRRGDSDQAQKHFARALELDPENAQALFRSGRAELHRLQDLVFADKRKLPDESPEIRDGFERARRLLSRSLEIRPDAPCVWATLGYSYAMDPRPAPVGIEIQQRAIQERGPRWTLVSNLAMIYVKVGQWQTAREIFETYLRSWAKPRAYWRLEALLVDAELEHVQTLIAADQLCEAVESLQRLATITEYEESKTEVVRHLDQLRQRPEAAHCEPTQSND